MQNSSCDWRLKKFHPWDSSAPLTQLSACFPFTVVASCIGLIRQCSSGCSVISTTRLYSPLVPLTPPLEKLWPPANDWAAKREKAAMPSSVYLFRVELSSKLRLRHLRKHTKELTDFIIASRSIGNLEMDSLGFLTIRHKLLQDKLKHVDKYRLIIWVW